MQTHHSHILYFQLELEIHRQLLDKDMADFIHIDVLGKSK
jgi:hypothetical protein